MIALSNAQILLERVKACQDMSDIRFLAANSGCMSAYPPDKPYVSFCDGEAKGEFLLGDASGTIMEEKVNISILTAEKHGAVYCRRCAERVCVRLMELDEESRIISVAAGEAHFDEASGGWRISISLGLRQQRVSGGDESENR